MIDASDIKSKGDSVPGDSVPFSLYLITDRRLTPDLLFSVEEALKGGCRAVQLREKDMGIRQLLELAYKMRELTERYNARLFINDRLDIALSVGADGVHLGQKSMPVRSVTHGSMTPFNNFNKLIIGVSTHNLSEAVIAEKGGAHFITLGPIYETQSKLQYGRPLGIETLISIRQKITIPIFAIGGIKTDNLKKVMSAGADGIAVISGIFSAPDIKAKTEDFQRGLK